MMKTVNIHEAKSTLSQLLVDVEHGEEVVIARNGVPVARLTPLQPVAPREPGLWQQFPGWEGFAHHPDLLAPMTDQEIEDEGWL